MLALLAPGSSPTLRAALRARYSRPVMADASLKAREAVAGRLESSVSAARMADWSAHDAALWSEPEKNSLNRGPASNLRFAADRSVQARQAAFGERTSPRGLARSGSRLPCPAA